MMRRFIFCTVLIVASLAPVVGQGTGQLSRDTQAFAQVVPGYIVDPVRDLAAHPDFALEWWYVTANITAEDGTPMGLQWTLFRSALEPENRPGWQNRHFWLAHSAVTTPSKHLYAEKFARGGVGQAGADTSPFHAWVDDWHIKEDATGAWRMHAATSDFSYDLSLRATAPAVLHGQNGYSAKAEEGGASYYFSQPHLSVEGTIEIDGKPQKVTGHAWMDREWTSALLARTQTGWDWFALRLDSGAKYMLFRVRSGDGNDFISATEIQSNGNSRSIPASQIAMTPQSWTRLKDKRLPTAWRFAIAGQSFDITALNPDSWMGTSIPYWEGPVEIKSGKSNLGVGYMELTGY